MSAPLLFGMIVLGITGGIGMGKSTGGTILKEHGVPVVDTDMVARELTGPGSDGVRRFGEILGAECVGDDGALKRDVAARILFEDPVRRRTIEEYLHPRIHAVWKARLTSLAAEGRSISAVLIPLLFEKSYESDFTAVVAVACSLKTQRERLRSRGWTDEHAARRIAAQMPVEDKVRRAHFVVWSEGSIECHRRQWPRILAQLPGL